MRDTYTTPYEPTALDRNGTAFSRGDSVVLLRDGHYVHADVLMFTNPANLGTLAHLRTRDGETLIVCADAVALTKRHLTRRAA